MIRVEDLEAFSGEVRRHNFGRRNPIGFLEEDPHKVVRNLTSFREPSVDEQSYQRYSGVINAWREFGSYPGIRVPSFTAYSNFYVVADFVEGETLDKKQFSSGIPQEIAVIGRFLESLVDYATYKYHNGGVYLSDQNLGQYMFGTTLEETTPGVYFVDLDHERGVLDTNTTSYAQQSRLFLTIISELFRDFEEKFAPNTFGEERHRLLALVQGSNP